MNISSLAWWSNFLGWSAVSLTALGALTGILAWYFAVQLNAAKDEVEARFKAESSEKLSVAEAKTSQANARAEEAIKEAARLNQLAEEERLARMEIEERVASRRLPERERQHLASRLQTFAGQKVSLWFNAGDHEASVFASELASTLESAKWDVYAPASLVHMLGSGRRGPTIVETGIVVRSTGDDESLKASAAIVRELTALGFNATKSATTENRTVPIVIIHIEARPEGPQGKAKLRRNVG